MISYLNNHINTSREGNIIIHGYKKHLLKDNHINYEINELFKLDYTNKIYYLDNKEDLKLCLKKMDYYVDKFENRYHYYNTLIIYYKEKELIRLPIYMDIFKYKYIYTLRELEDKYYSFVNIK